MMPHRPLVTCGSGPSKTSVTLLFTSRFCRQSNSTKPVKMVFPWLCMWLSHTSGVIEYDMFIEKRKAKTKDCTSGNWDYTETSPLNEVPLIPIAFSCFPSRMSLHPVNNNTTNIGYNWLILWKTGCSYCLFL